MKTFMLASICACLLTGCYVPNKIYRLPKDSLIQVPPKPASLQPHRQKDGPACTAQSLRERPCLAFLEFDDMGEKWSQADQPITPGNDIDNTTQLSNAVKIIRTAIQQDPHALIITFMHGWKHNAGPDDTNIEGFKQVLNDFYDSRYHGHVVVGIFISWRGNLVSEHWPVRQAFTYFNREATAARIPGPSLTDALIAIATTAHENDDLDNHPLIVLVGHSFGGLLLERGVAQTMVDQIKSQELLFKQAQMRVQRQTHSLAESVDALPSGLAQGSPLKEQTQSLQQTLTAPASDTGQTLSQAQAQTIGSTLQQMREQADATSSPALERSLNRANEVVHSMQQLRLFQFKPLADLVIFVNSAGAATEAKETLDFFASTHLTYTVDGRPAPLFLSVSSSADLATRLAMPIGHGLPFLNYKTKGSFRDVDQLACFNPKTDQSHFLDPPPTQGAFFMSTAAHMQILQSHLLEEETDSARRQSCTLANYSSDPAVIGTYPLKDAGRCFKIEERPTRCNGTPYWIMEIDPSIVPDHSTIFTDRFLSFLTLFIPDRNHLEQNIRPRLSVQ